MSAPAPNTPSHERERYAEALAIESAHGDGVHQHVMDRIITMAIFGDDAGIRRWAVIGERLEKLRAGTLQ